MVLNFLGCVIHHWKGVFKTFPKVYYKPPNFNWKNKRKFAVFSDCRAGWSKELQWENTNVFYKCIEGKLGICLLLAMFIAEDWMINHVIIYIKKIIAKALHFNDIIKKIMGMSA